jgi:hypothetical protein
MGFLKVSICRNSPNAVEELTVEIKLLSRTSLKKHWLENISQ